MEKSEDNHDMSGLINPDHAIIDVPKDTPVENEMDMTTNIDHADLDVEVTNALLSTSPLEHGASRRASRVSKRKHSIRTEEPLGKDIDKDMIYDDEDWASEYEEFEDDDKEKEGKDANLLGNIVLKIQKGVGHCVGAINKLTRGRLFSTIFLVGYIAYVITAIQHKFGDEASIRLVACTVLGIIIMSYPYIIGFCRKAFIAITGSKHLSPRAKFILGKFRFVTRWILYAALAAVMVYVVVDEGRKSTKNLRSLPGLAIFLLICLLMSKAPSQIIWHTIYWAMGLQFIFALLVLRWDKGKESILWIQSRLDQFFANSQEGSKFVFGEKYTDHYMLFGALPILFMSNAVLVVLYYLGAMQFLIRVIGTFLSFVMDTTPVESMSVATSIFLEGAISLLTFRPFLGSLTRSQLFLVITSTLSSLGGAYIALLSSLGIPTSVIIPAMLVSAPATFAVCKLIYPEKCKNANKLNWQTISVKEKEKYTNVMDAAQDGAISMLPLGGTIISVAFVFVSMISWVNQTLDWFGQRVGSNDLSIEFILSYVLFPVSLAMGIEWEDCRRVAMLQGYRIGSANIIAFMKLTELKVNKAVYMQYMEATNFTGPVSTYRDDITLDLWNKTLNYGYLSDRSETIVTYSLCGFSSMIIVTVTLGIVYTLVPRRRVWLGKMTIPAMVAGNVANCMTGCFASLFY